MKDELDSQTQELPLRSLSEPQRGRPPMVGWWLVRRIGNNAAFATRRWWNGSDWSAPVPVGVDERWVEDCRKVITPWRPESFEFVGLLKPAPEYPYMLSANEEVWLNADEQDAQSAILMRAFYEMPVDAEDIDHSVRGIGTGIQTGRISSTEPATSNVPKSGRRQFGA